MLKYDLTVWNPNLSVSKPHRQIIIEAEIVDQTDAGPKPSGNAIRLGMTAADAMRLLTLLKSAQQQLGLPDWHGEVTMTSVPPAKQKN
jgi:hypothetical protein